jgi:cytochrome c oxidase assembly protein subunit 15
MSTRNSPRVKSLLRYLPSTIDRRVRVIAWFSLACQILLIGTGGAVRLTGSGLGCPTWPRCTADSFVSTPAMGINGAIEFGNRMLTFVLAIVVILAFLAVIRMRRQRRDLFVITLLQGLSIPAQAVLGGITVLTGLNPYIVGAHFVISMALVVLTTVFVYRVYNGPRGNLRLGPSWLRRLSITAAVFAGFAVILGVLTTGSGPHAGDAATPRNGLDSELLEHIHSWPAYALLGCTVVLVVAVLVLRLPGRRWFVGLLGVEILQIIVGITQSNLGLPPLLVGIHMLLAALLTAAMTASVVSLRSSGTATFGAAETATPLIAARGASVHD